MEERLQKLLSAAGICSRRRAEEYIQQGRVTVNGKPAALGDRADPGRDTIALDGKAIGRRRERRVLMLYKPRGVVTTLSDEKGRPTVAALVSGCGGRVWPVGRLDMDSEGLLLLTDDGELTNTLLHPRHEVEKEYLVWVSPFRPEAVEELARPMTLDGQRLRPAKVRLVRAMGERAILSVVIHEGKNRQVRRMCARQGLQVHRLKRVREGGLTLDRSLAPGQWRPLGEEEIARLAGPPAREGGPRR